MATILLVDDDVVFLDQLSTTLTSLSHQVATATSIDEAVAWLATQKAEAIICDTIMEGGGAVTLLHLVRETYPGVPFIVITGRTAIATSPLFERGMTEASAKIEKSASGFEIDRLLRSLIGK